MLCITFARSLMLEIVKNAQEHMCMARKLCNDGTSMKCRKEKFRGKRAENKMKQSNIVFKI